MLLSECYFERNILRERGRETDRQRLGWRGGRSWGAPRPGLSGHPCAGPREGWCAETQLALWFPAGGIGRASPGERPASCCVPGTAPVGAWHRHSLTPSRSGCCHHGEAPTGLRSVWATRAGRAPPAPRPRQVGVWAGGGAWGILALAEPEPGRLCLPRTQHPCLRAPSSNAANERLLIPIFRWGNCGSGRQGHLARAK